MSSSFTTHTGGRRGTRRCLVAAAVLLCVSLPGAHRAAAADPGPPPDVSVREERGFYSVTARFVIPQSARTALAVLSDYEEIPRFMPDVRRSVILDRSPGRFVVEQEAVAKFMMFSKRVHLVLEVQQSATSLKFRDRCGKSFAHYEGAWTVTEAAGQTTVTYQLKARPSFDVPEFVLKRLLKRDSVRMIERLEAEIAARK